MQTAGPNAQQIEYWNQQAGPRWVSHQEFLDAQIAPLGRLAMERGLLAPGERVIDVGCGCGDSTLEIARRVGAAGAVVGIDLSAVMLERARERSRAANAGNASFLQADAQTHAFEPATFDLLYSRFGVMFFADPVAAFVNLRRALRASGRLAFVCWQPLARNPWMLVPLAAAAKHVELPKPPPPGAPGPFAFGDPDHVRSILGQAGYADVSIEPVESELSIGGADLDSTVEFLLGIGPAAAALRDASREQRALVGGAIREAIAPFSTPEGVRMRGSTWIVRARAGASRDG
jgi:SAM-dependent methyltransferase